ncbi:hypothetical protein ACFZAT_31140 [Streptomyces sp. NPDC008163]|uniref:hypothetical protein n=1 Tax=Streptomyces sp. NPDC008163 TaxID=3364818 RepID=UPI0036E3FDBF
MRNHDITPTTEASSAPVAGEDMIRPAPERPASTPASMRGRVLDLIAFVVLLTVAACVFAIAGPAAFTTVTSVGMVMYSTWRSTQQRPPSR